MLENGQLFNESTKMIESSIWSNILLKSKDDFIAHIYVRYLGDMRGGQIISKKIPGNGKYYDFNNPQKLASSIYQLLNDEMADEAKKVFNFATLLFQEMYEMMSLNNEL